MTRAVLSLLTDRMWPKTKGSQSCSDSTAGAHRCQGMKSLCLQPHEAAVSGEVGFLGNSFCLGPFVGGMFIFLLENKRSTRNTCPYSNNKFTGDVNPSAHVESEEQEELNPPPWRGSELVAQRILLFHFNSQLNCPVIQDFGGETIWGKNEY